jgi:hypothetical protein
VLASIMSTLWVVGGVAWALSLYRQEFSLVEFLTNPVVFPFAAGILLPAAGFLLLAVLIRRMQELRIIARSMSEVTVRLAEPENLSTDTVVTVGQAIRREVAALGDGVERAIARATELEAMVKNEVSTLERAYDDNEMRVRNLIDELQSERDSILSHAGRLRESITHSHEAFTLDAEQIAERVNSGITEATDRVSTVITEATDRVSTVITARSEEARSQIATAGDLVIEAMTIKASETTERMTQVGIEVGKALASRSAIVSEAFEESANAVSAQIAATGRRAAEHLTDSTFDLNGRVMTALENFDATVKVQGAGMVEQLAQIAEKTQNSVSELDKRLAKREHELAESFESRSSLIEQAIAERTQSLDETLANRTLEIARSLADGNKAANEAIEKTVAGMGEYFAEKARVIADTISASAEAADQSFGARAQQVAEEMTKRVAAVEQTLGSRADSLVDGLDIRVNRFEGIIDGKFQTIANSIDGKAAEAAEIVARKVENVSETLRKNAVEVERLLGGLTEQVSKGLAERTREVGVTHEILRNDVSGILEKLGHANALVQSVADGVSTQLLPLEQQVTERMTYLQTSIEATTASTRGAIEWADGQVRDLREVAAGVLRDLSALTLRFENQGRVITGVAETLSETHGRIDETLEERRLAIEDIVNLLVTRSDEFEGKLLGRTHEISERLRGFQQVLEDTLSGSQARAEEITKLMADTTVHTTQQINSQYELIRGAYAEERGRTNVALKSTYQDAVDDMARMFREMIEHFTESSRELRSVTEQVQHTLAETRDELKDGLRDLPNETIETTQAMRRMVADQLKAIAQLSEVISWRTRVTEVAEPSERRAAPREEPSEAPRQARERPGVNGNGNGDGSHAPSPRSRAAEPRERRPDDEIRRPRPSEDYRASEIAARPVPPPIPPSPEAFDTLAGDIPRLVSHEATIEAWDRYKRGERNVFSRKLYTSQGHRAFEEIRRKYRRSGDFRETVDRYIDEFEHLLDQVARDDRGQVLTKTYLNSDTGKVYTLLAHAAGRLE